MSFGNNKTYLRTSLWMVAVALFLIQTVMTGLRDNWSVAIMGAIWFAVVAIITSILIAVATVQKEKMLTYLPTAFIVLLVSKLGEYAISSALKYMPI